MTGTEQQQINSLVLSCSAQKSIYAYLEKQKDVHWMLQIQIHFQQHI